MPRAKAPPVKQTPHPWNRAHPGDERPTGARAPVTVSVQEQRERIELVERLYVMGVTLPRIEAALRERYGPRAAKAARTLLNRVRARWSEEETANRTYWKEQAMRRVITHVQKARELEQMGAVAQLERLLSEMQGTREPEQLVVSGSIGVHEARMQLIAQLPEEELKALAEEHRKIIEAHGEPVIEGTKP